ncbi:hypothetical protein D3C77_293390 [compost metagenome]
MPLGGAGDQDARGLVGADFGLGAGLLAFVVIEDVPPDARDHAPIARRQPDPGRKARRRQRRLDEQGVDQDVAARRHGAGGFLGPGPGGSIDGAGALGGGQQGLGRGLAGAQAADLIPTPPVPILIRGDDAFARQGRLAVPGQDDRPMAHRRLGRVAGRRQGPGGFGFGMSHERGSSHSTGISL